MNRTHRSTVLAPVLALVLAACAKAPSPGSGSQPAPSIVASGSASEAPVDEVLLAWLSAARSLHHEADLAEDQKNLKGAIAPLERLLVAKRPRAAPEIDEVLADTYARLGDLRSQLDDFDAAGRDVDSGLMLAKQISYYRGHLLEVRGLIEERRSKALAKKGDTAGAAKAAEAAKKAFEEAVSVNFEFIDKHSDGGKK